MALQVWLPLLGSTVQQGLSNATVTNCSATANNSGKIGKCYSFDGTGNQYIIGTQSYFTNATATEWSYACWIKVNNSHNGCIWSCRNSTNNAGMTIFYYSGSWIFDDGNRWQFSPNTTISSGVWYHICFTRSATTGKRCFYLNGVLDSTTSTSTAPTNVCTTHFAIGNSQNSAQGLSGNPFNGYLNDVRLYSHALSPKEIEILARGLVLHYPLSDPYIEDTTNLCPQLTDTCYNAVNQKYGYGTNTDMYKDVGIFQGRQCSKVRMGTNGQSAHPYVFFSNLNPADNSYKTVSFDYYPTILDKIVFYSWSGTGEMTYRVNYGPATSGGTIPVKINQWNHIVLTIKAISTSIQGFGYMQIGNTAHTSNTSNYWLFANVQVESNDHATGVVIGGTTRSNRLTYDISGQCYNGTNNASLPVNLDTPKYSHSTVFNGSSVISTTNFLIGNIWSYGIWYKSDNLSSGWQSVVLLNTSGGDTDTQLGFYTNHSQSRLQSTANGSYNSQIALPHDTNWHHYFCTYDGSSMKTYLDGVLVDTTTITAALKQRSNLVVGARSNNSAGTSFTAYFSGQLSDFRMYATVLTAEDIAEIYNTTTSISNT